MSGNGWPILLWNSNTINGYLPAMITSGAEVVVAVETHATSREGEWYKDHLARKGWGSVWTDAVITQRGRTSGGVAILSQGGPVEPITPPDDLVPFVQEGRLVMGVVHSHVLGSEVRIYALYGDPYSVDGAEKLLQGVVQFAAGWNHRPQIILGDLNLTKDSVVLGDILMRGGWCDAVPRSGAEEDPSCFPNGQPSRIDHILVNGVLAKSSAEGGGHSR